VYARRRFVMILTYKKLEGVEGMGREERMKK